VIGGDEEPIMIALLMRAWQTLACAYDLALRGYYPQALNLQRAPIEDWLAYWYLRSFPAEHPRFADLKQTTPSFNDMLQRIEAKHGSDAQIRTWIKRLHKYSHVDRLGVRMVILPSPTVTDSCGSSAQVGRGAARIGHCRTRQDGPSFALGPQQNALLFRYCAEEASATLLSLIEAVENLRRLMKCGPLAASDEYMQRRRAWQATFAETANEDPPTRVHGNRRHLSRFVVEREGQR
jgi:hypothetical protein